MANAKTRVLTGIKPTGDLHIGNFAGAIRPCVEFSKNPSYETILMCADWHGLTDRAKIEEPGKFTVSTLATFLALGYELKGNILMLQSDFSEIQEVAWYLSCVSVVGLLERAHAYKDQIAAGKKPTCGLFYYPVLMAADIVTFDADVVPVGKDQAQHLEYASDMAKLFNNAVEKEVFKEPKPLVQEVPSIVGTDGERKMSKSYNNHIPLFAPKKEIESRIKGIKTDSKGVDDPKDPSTCAVYQILQSFGSFAAIADMKEKLEKGKGYGYGHAKMDLIAEHERVFGQHRQAYEHFCQSPDEMSRLMKEGYERARAYASDVKLRARKALGMRHYGDRA